MFYFRKIKGESKKTFKIQIKCDEKQENERESVSAHPIMDAAELTLLNENF